MFTGLQHINPCFSNKFPLTTLSVQVCESLGQKKKNNIPEVFLTRKAKNMNHGSPLFPTIYMCVCVCVCVQVCVRVCIVLFMIIYIYNAPFLILGLTATIKAASNDVPSTAKYPLLGGKGNFAADGSSFDSGGTFCEENFLRFLD